MSNQTNTIPQQTNSKRKLEHLNIALNEDIEFKDLTTGLEAYRFVHQALPEIDLSSIDLSTTLFGKKLNAPLLISPMVGGVEQAREINRNLAKAAQEVRVGMGVGSQRTSIEDPSFEPTYEVRDIAPDILLFANLGAVQLNNGYGIAECERAVNMIDADALTLHLNPLQEALQHDGNTNFGGLLLRIEKICRELSKPVIVKEVGWGISETVAHKLDVAGVSGIDVAGAGGSSWSEVERYRTCMESGNNVAAAFAAWGIPTADSITLARRGAPSCTLIASGGIRTGMDVAKSIALGADAAGVGLPLLKASTISAEAVVTYLREIIDGLRLAMFCVGARSLSELKDSPFLIRKGEY